MRAWLARVWAWFRKPFDDMEHETPEDWEARQW